MLCVVMESIRTTRQCSLSVHAGIRGEAMRVKHTLGALANCGGTMELLKSYSLWVSAFHQKQETKSLRVVGLQNKKTRQGNLGSKPV